MGHDDDRVLDDGEDYGDDYGYGYGQKKVQQENLYDNYDKLDVRETILRANQLWDGDVLDQAIRDLIAAGNAEVGALNDTHQALVLRILEAVDWQGEESDIKLILTQAGESDIDLYGETDVSGLGEEERTASWNPAQYTSSSWGRQHAYTRPSYG